MKVSGACLARMHASQTVPGDGVRRRSQLVFGRYIQLRPHPINESPPSPPPIRPCPSRTSSHPRATAPAAPGRRAASILPDPTRACPDASRRRRRWGAAAGSLRAAATRPCRTACWPTVGTSICSSAWFRRWALAKIRPTCRRRSASRPTCAGSMAPGSSGSSPRPSARAEATLRAGPRSPSSAGTTAGWMLILGLRRRT